MLLHALRDRLSPSRQLTVAGVVFGAGLVGLAFADTLLQAVVLLVPIGVAWIAVIAGLNATTQAFLPDWVRARAQAVHQTLEVVIHYRVRPEREEEFLSAIGALRTSRLRTGATQWALMRDAVDEGHLVERYRVASWADHRDQHDHRLTPFDRDVELRVESLSDSVSPAEHLLFVAVPHHPRTHTGGTQ